MEERLLLRGPALIMSILSSKLTTRRVLFTLIALGVAQACGSSSEGDGDRRRPGTGGTSGTGGSDAGSSGTGNTDAGEADSSSDAAPSDASGDGRADGSAGTAGSAGSDAGRDAASDARADAPTTLAECEIISCGGAASNHGCCGDVFSFALGADDHPAASLQTGFSATAAAATASFSFTAADQDGAIGVRLTPARRPTLIDLTATVSGTAGQRPFCTLEAGGTSGCAYPFKANWQADLDTPLFCWGASSFTPETLTIRTESSGAGNVTLTVTDIDIR